MQTIEELKYLVEYNEWANRRVLNSLKRPSEPSARGVRALSHLLIAEKEWMARLKDTSSARSDFWPPSSVAECEALYEETAQAYREFVDGLKEEGLETRTTYKNSKGIQYTSTYRDVLTHVLMHSAYHRGQVAMAVRAEGGEPAYTDYIGFVRENEQ
jgi:uncharacterized damage-inducible protein DinB